MKKNKNQFYVVWEGHQPGLYDNWEKCRKQVEGYPAAKYKGFASLPEAQAAQNESPWKHFNKGKDTLAVRGESKNLGYPRGSYLCVDAACSGNPGVLEYRGVYMPTHEEVFRRGPFPEGTTNIGEFLAIVTGLAWLKQRSLDIPLYSDSKNGILWARNKRINTKLPRGPKNEELFDVLEKALAWLNSNNYPNPVYKWETGTWGEIPADFGRK